jgi:hypothetical protein
MSTKPLAHTRAISVVKSPPLGAKYGHDQHSEPPKPEPPLPVNTHWEAFRDLERDADELLERWSENIGGDYTGTLAKRCAKTRAFFEKELAAFVERDGSVTKNAIGARIGMVIEYIGAPPSPVHIRTMTCHVADTEPDAYAFESACREMELTCKPFRPVLSQFMPILKKHDALWRKRWAAIRNVNEGRKAAAAAARANARPRLLTGPAEPKDDDECWRRQFRHNFGRQ